MSMQSWGYSELLLNMEKAKAFAGDEYKIMEFIIDEEEIEPQDIEEGNYSKTASSAISKFIHKILHELEVEIYPRYISSEAEGADGLEGSIIWCVEPEYQDKIVNAMEKEICWSEFG